MQDQSGRRRRVDVVRSPAADATPEAFATMVGQALRRIRQERGWTQAELAEAAGLSSNYVARLERGELVPSFLVVHQLCTALGVQPNELIEVESAPKETARRRVR